MTYSWSPQSHQKIGRAEFPKNSGSFWGGDIQTQSPEEHSHSPLQSIVSTVSQWKNLGGSNEFPGRRTIHEKVTVFQASGMGTDTFLIGTEAPLGKTASASGREVWLG